MTSPGPSHSTFSDNSTDSASSAGRGGAIANDSFGPLRVTNSTFSGNTFTYIGGAIVNSSYRRMTIVHSAFSDNAAGVLFEDDAIFSDEGGAIFNDGPATLRNTIVADSPSGGNCGVFVPDYGANLVTDGGHNVSDDDTCNLTQATGSLPDTDPLLDPEACRTTVVPPRQ